MQSQKCSRPLLYLIQKTDLRLLILLCPALGVLAWHSPWPWLCVPLALALWLLVCGLQALPWLKKFLKVYLFFALFWLICSFFFQNLDKSSPWPDILVQTGLLALRFACLPGLALPLILAASPIRIGLACAWYACALSRVFLVPAGIIQPQFRNPEVNPGWKVGLAVALTISLIPRVYRDLSALQRSLNLRAPKLKAGKKARLICLGALRLFGEQTWEQSLALTSRQLDQPEVWRYISTSK